MLILPETITCGYWNSREFCSDEFSPPRRVAKFEIEYFPENAKYTYLDDQRIPIHADHILIARPGQIRYSQLPFSTLYLRFSAEGEIARQLEENTGCFPTVNGAELRSRMEELFLLQEKRQEQEFLFAGKFLLFLDLVLREIGHGREDGNLPEAVLRAKRFLRENFARPLRLADVSAQVHLSPTYFHRLFTLSQNQSPHDYLLQCRIANAKRMLRNTADSMDAVAEACGFGCQQYLNKIFKQKTGQTPGEYRRRAQQNYVEEE